MRRELVEIALLSQRNKQCPPHPSSQALPSLTVPHGWLSPRWHSGKPRMGEIEPPLT